MIDAARRNPATAKASEATLPERLYYFDFRDLQDVVTSKGLWAMFEPVFGTKEMFTNRCTQLAELRNTIRHSRPLDGVTQKDGEAALYWFGDTLPK
jgi:hypothetical protein